MRPRVLAILIAAVLALAFGLIGNAADVDGLQMAAGILWLVAIVLGVSLLPFWRKVLPDVPTMPGLFSRPGDGERWCSRCGSVTAKGPCATCGHGKAA